MTEESTKSYPVKDTETDPFVRSMTFALGVTHRDCDCDECFVSVPLPTSVSDAIRQHKRRKLMETPVRRTQERTLVARDQGISIWKLVMPLDAEPLVEFGSSHRIVFVHALEPESEIKAIGKGIIGSSTEESGRKLVCWKKGNAYLIPSNGGKALGWIHTTSQSGTDSQPKGHVVLYTIKIPVDSIENDSSNDEESNWVRSMCRICKNVLPRSLTSATNSEEMSSSPPGYQEWTGFHISESDCNIIEKALGNVIGKRPLDLVDSLK